MDNESSFFNLTPDVILQAVDRAGYPTRGEILQLNSYENRVFAIKLEAAPFDVIAKFYRPGRWTKAALIEEHEFLLDLASAGVPAVAPFQLAGASTLWETHGMYMTLFPKARGRLVQDLSDEDLIKIGRALAKMHNIGAQKTVQHRPVMTVAAYGWQSLERLKTVVAPEFWREYESLARAILSYLEEQLDPSTFHRIHGDCHRGNILQTDEPGQPKQFFFVDFDDFCSGPTAQDFWMLCLGDEDEAEKQLAALLSGYEEFRHFDHRQIALMEPLRGLRLIYYAAWIARRWEDPSFPQLFPDYGSTNYWFEEIQSLRPIADSL